MSCHLQTQLTCMNEIRLVQAVLSTIDLTSADGIRLEKAFHHEIPSKRLASTQNQDEDSVQRNGSNKGPDGDIVDGSLHGSTSFLLNFQSDDISSAGTPLTRWTLQTDYLIETGSGHT